MSRNAITTPDKFAALRARFRLTAAEAVVLGTLVEAPQADAETLTAALAAAGSTTTQPRNSLAVTMSRVRSKLAREIELLDGGIATRTFPAPTAQALRVNAWELTPTARVRIGEALATGAAVTP